jgi:hypothetical protein
MEKVASGLTEPELSAFGKRLTHFKSARSKYDLDRVLGFVGGERI